MSAEEKNYVFSGTQVNSVDVFLEGLRGETLLRAQAAVDELQGAKTLGDLDSRIRKLAALVPDVSPEVTPAVGKDDGIYVYLRPAAMISSPSWWRTSMSGGVQRWELDPVVAVRAEAPLGPHAWASRPIVGGLGGLVSLGSNVTSGVLRFSPFRYKHYAPALELGASTSAVSARTLADLPTPSKGAPVQTAQSAAIVLPLDTKGVHELRLKASSRELVPDPQASEKLFMSPLRTTKTYLGYNFFQDCRPAFASQGKGDLRHLNVELSGLLGDVSLLRAEGTWAYEQTGMFGGGVLELSASAGFVAPLNQQTEAATVPFEDRLFLGGSVATTGERLLGFAERRVGFVAKRQSESESFDHLGGEARVSASVSTTWPVPRSPLHCRVFGSVGALAEKAQATFSDFSREARASVGVCVGMPIAAGGFVGFSCSLPFLAHRNDTLRPFQFWLSLRSPM